MINSYIINIATFEDKVDANQMLRSGWLAFRLNSALLNYYLAVAERNVGTAQKRIKLSLSPSADAELLQDFSLVPDELKRKLVQAAYWFRYELRSQLVPAEFLGPKLFVALYRDYSSSLPIVPSQPAAQPMLLSTSNSVLNEQKEQCMPGPTGGSGHSVADRNTVERNRDWQNDEFAASEGLDLSDIPLI